MWSMTAAEPSPPMMPSAAADELSAANCTPAWADGDAGSSSWAITAGPCGASVPRTPPTGGALSPRTEPDGRLSATASPASAVVVVAAGTTPVVPGRDSDGGVGAGDPGGDDGA